MRLVSLHHWSFTSTSHGPGFHGLAARLDRSPAGLSLPGADGLRARASIDETGAIALTTEHGPASDADPGTAAVVADPGFGPAWAFGGATSRGPAFRGVLTDPTRFTIACWVKPRTVESSSVRVIAGGAPGPSGRRRACPTHRRPG